jgi:rod shape-determining protein MreC
MKIADVTSLPLRASHGIGASLRGALPWHALRQENELLRRENDLLIRKLAEKDVLVNENDRLKELLNFRKTISFTTIPAQVIGRDPTNWSNSVIIDKGSATGIKGNKAVVSTKGLVGRVLELGRFSAKILLITDPNSKVGVIIQRNGQGGMVIGRPEGMCKMIYIALDSDVRPGDTVVTAGFGAIFPKGVLVGEIVKVGREPGRLYAYAIVRPAQEMSKLEEVLCIQ